MTLNKQQNQFFQHQISGDSESLMKSKSKNLIQSETSKFNKFQIVWAKITGYPWWPAIISTVPDEKDDTHIQEDFKNGRYFSQMNSNTSMGYRVDFIADQTHAYLKRNFLLKYKDNRQKLYKQGLQFSRRKRRFFQMAINQADQLYQVLQISKNEVSQSNIKQSKLSEKNAVEQSQSQQQENSGSSNQSQQDSDSDEHQKQEFAQEKMNQSKAQKLKISKQTNRKQKGVNTYPIKRNQKSLIKHPKKQLQKQLSQQQNEQAHDQQVQQSSSQNIVKRKSSLVKKQLLGPISIRKRGRPSKKVRVNNLSKFNNSNNTNNKQKKPAGNNNICSSHLTNTTPNGLKQKTPLPLHSAPLTITRQKRSFLPKQKPQQHRYPPSTPSYNTNNILFEQQQQQQQNEQLQNEQQLNQNQNIIVEQQQDARQQQQQQQQKQDNHQQCQQTPQLSKTYLPFTRKRISTQKYYLFQKFQNQKEKEKRVTDILQKYKLDKIDEIQNEYRLKVLENSRLQELLQNKNQTDIQNIKIKGSRGMTFIKNALSLANKRRSMKKASSSSKIPTEESLFSQNLSILSRLKTSQHQKLTSQQKSFLVQYCKKWTSRKLYMIVDSILKKNNKYPLNHEAIQNIRKRCVDLAAELFDEEEFEKIENEQRQRQLQRQHQRSQHNVCNNNRKKSTSSSTHNANNGSHLNFIILFKRKLQQCVRFLRFYCLENWQFLIKSGSFSQQLCILVKSFQQYLSSTCGLLMKNQQKFQDIIKQIGIQNQKTAFACGHNMNEMENQNDVIGNLNLIEKINEEEISKVFNINNSTCIQSSVPSDEHSHSIVVIETK